MTKEQIAKQPQQERTLADHAADGICRVLEDEQVQKATANFLVDVATKVFHGFFGKRQPQRDPAQSSQIVSPEPPRIESPSASNQHATQGRTVIRTISVRTNGQ